MTVKTTSGSSITAAACHALSRSGMAVCLWRRLTGDTTAGQGFHLITPALSYFVYLTVFGNLGLGLLSVQHLSPCYFP